MALAGTSIRRQPTRQPAWAAPTAITGSACFSLIIVALHFLRPDLNPVSSMASEYVNGPHGLLMTCAFFRIYVATMSVIIGLYQGVPGQARA